MLSVLVIEDETILAKNIATYLRRLNHEVKHAQTGEIGLALVESERPDVVILDYNLPGMDGLELLPRIQAIDASIKTIMATGQGSEQLAVDAMKAGAYDYLIKPLVLGKLKMVLDKIMGEARVGQELDYYRKKEAGEGGIEQLVGESSPMLLLKGLISQVLEAERCLVDAEPPAVLVTGETGAGKELVARALHYAGPRRAKPFIEVNCSSIPTNLLEAELFGYERGAFTDAKERKLGLIEAAEGGTLFLDEIGEIDLTLQAKLLKLLEDKRVRRLGAVRENKVDVRIVTATNRNLEQQIRDGKFRADLYFRLRIVQLEVPPLRERSTDIELLAEHFLAIHRTRYGKSNLRFSPEVLSTFAAYGWPGNVREMRNAIEQSVILARSDVLFPSDLSFSGDLSMATTELNLTPPTVIQLPMTTIPPGGLKLSDVERTLVVQALERCGGNVSKAARLLGISRDTLRYRMDKYQLRLAL
jgi:two-component system, NtrC family, response regulator AtoC